MKKVIVAGGAGFIGYHLIQKLLKKNCHVTCIDSLVTGNKDHIQHFCQHPHFIFIEHEIQKSIDIEAKEIYNLACPASPKAYKKNPLYTLDTNYLGTKNLLELAKKYQAKFFQASTSEIYGDPLEHPQQERYYGNVNCFGVRACYDEGKRVAETLCYEYCKTFGVDVRIARIFNTYGPKMRVDDGRAVSNFIQQALCNQPLTIFGSGAQTRSFCFVEDLIEGIEHLMHAPLCNTPVNLGNPEEISILSLAQKILEICQSSSSICFLPIEQDDPKIRKPDIAQASRLFNWKPKVSIDQGLRFTVEDFFARIAASR